MLQKNKIYQGDCLEVMKLIDDKSIDLIVIDPPYNINKETWDTWKTVESYVEWMGKIFTQCERVLKNNASFYFFHNDFLQIVELQNWLNKNSNFIFKQLIVWNKRFEKSKNKGFLDGYVELNGLRNYQKMSEYCLFYTFQDETGLNKIKQNTEHFTTLRQYFKKIQDFINKPKTHIIKSIGQQADHCFRWNSSQFDLPTFETYKKIIEIFKIDKMDGFKEYETLRQEYETLRQEYETLRQEYETLRYTFNNQKTHHSVWDYDIASKIGHITPKPVDLIENIILHSTNEGDLILDCTAGSMTLAVASDNLSRNWLCIEKDENYCKLGLDRVNKNRYLKCLDDTEIVNITLNRI